MQFFFLFFSSIFFEKNLTKPKNRPQGARGGGRGQIFFYPNFYYFFLGAHAKFQNPTTTPSGRISNEPEEERKRERRREKNAIYSGHLRLCQQPRAAHALRSDQNTIYSGHLCFCLQPRAAHALRSDQQIVQWDTNTWQCVHLVKWCPGLQPNFSCLLLNENISLQLNKIEYWTSL